MTAAKSNLVLTGDGAELVAALERIAQLESELKSAQRMIGYLVTEYGNDGEALISNSTLFRCDGFKLIRKDEVRGGISITAIPNQ